MKSVLSRITRAKQVVTRRYLCLTTMAKSKFEYVKGFERDDNCLPNCWIVIRIDGRNFSRFCDTHQFVKPNDVAALELMNRAAITVMEDFKEIILGFGQSDEYSFVFRKDTQLYKRRASKLMSNVNSLFASAYVYHWSHFFRSKELYYPPSFDARVILYPTDKNLRDYLAWRQADVHINNLYNTCFWNLILKGKLTPSQAEEKLRGTLASHKNELLFQEFSINYNNEPPLFRKGTTLIRKLVPDSTGRLKPTIVPLIDDIIGDRFWKENPEVIGLKSLVTYQPPSLTNSFKSTMSVSTPSSSTIVKLENNVPSSSQVINSVNEETHSNKSRETNGNQMQCESERICRK
ncbi:PREDICTED: probable tRNA(His) guanylyltransferase isoform X2 [Acromyrmex echinatior]|uniref:probable tRNA(His) guanylyltransferase isoform X2 n=1 Tax=Acromyrmex echinatior TaxID=103372 RepID=UPI000580E1E7|nr:PREDICTED: probable tRNA(His) guanylyltransferase isoform X2 [Acromyrmex echinatior]